MMDLISTAVGGRVLACNDEFFAEAANLIQSGDPVWREGEYTDRGKWMDGWETRRRRQPGHDWCVLALGIPGRVRRVVIDTSFFTGNYPERFSLEACGPGSDERIETASWEEIIPATPLSGDARTVLAVDDPHRVTHLRLNIYPDGGVARLRVEGDPIPSISQVCPSGPVDLLSSLVGGEALAASDTHYSQPSNLLRPTAPAGMWDGWETKRRRGPGHDWATFRLGMPGVVDTVVVDTTHFKGNSPGWVSIDLSPDGETWSQAIEMVPVEAHVSNRVPIGPPRHARYARLSIHPDGGVARLRALGVPDHDAAGAVRLEYVNSLFLGEARRFFHSGCASSAWVETMVAARPFPDLERLFSIAGGVFDRLEEAEWLEAFAGHPRIGERGDAEADREQAGTAAATRETLRQLKRVNTEYEEKFGFTYIVYATGKSAEQMLEIAHARLANDRATEIAAAAHEQRRITDTRLRRMTCQEPR
jgi:allantoicase